MIIAGWILAILGLVQVIYAGTMDVSQLVEGNRLLGIPPNVMANVDMVAQRSMVHQSGCASFLAGAIFLGAAYLKPPPAGVEQRSWSSMGAITAGSLALGALIGFGLFLWALHARNADLRLVEELRVSNAQAENSERLWGEVDRRLAREAQAMTNAKAPLPDVTQPVEAPKIEMKR